MFYKFVVALCLFLTVGRIADAASSDALYGYWRDAKTGDSYLFNRDQTYTFQAGPQKRRSGNLSHSGKWTVEDTDEEIFVSGKGTPADANTSDLLRLTATQRQVKLRGRVTTRGASRVFELPYRHVYRFPSQEPIYLSKNGRHYYREAEHPEKVHWINLSDYRIPSQILIGVVVFTRVK